MAAIPATKRPRAAKPLTMPVERFTLSNGLRVVVSPDRSSPAVALAAYVDVGFRSEPRDRSGFAHLFEHLLFQGSASLAKGAFDQLVEGNGGTSNGSTNPDYTNYYLLMPSAAADLGVFLLADMFRAPLLTPETLANQIDVVSEEIRVNVLNQPYGAFPWILLPQTLFSTWQNSHDGYGSFEDLQAATVDDAWDFFDRYYVPGNTVLSIAGDITPEEALVLAERHFGEIEARPVPVRPDFDEPVPDAERRSEHLDKLAPLPAVAVAWRAPDPSAAIDDYAALTVLSSVLANEDGTRLFERLVRRDASCVSVDAQVGMFDPWDVRHPTWLEVSATMEPDASVDAVVDAVSQEIGALVSSLRPDEVTGAATGIVSMMLEGIDDLMTRSQMLGVFELQRDDPALLNRLPALVGTVEPERVAAVADRWLRPEQRTVVHVVAGAGE